jgi:hypothetical protein
MFGNSRQNRQAVKEDMEGFMCLNALLSDYVLSDSVERFNRWLAANDSSNEPMSDDMIRGMLQGHMVIAQRLVAVNRSPIFRRRF